MSFFVNYLKFIDKLVRRLYSDDVIQINLGYGRSHVDKRPIGIVDSGIGGISILNKVRDTLPHEDYIYYADTIHNPYGNKTLEELKEIMNGVMEKLLRKNVKLVIVACNTASTQVISYLREKYHNILFVAVEPAIKVAYDYYPERNVLVMATPGTIHSERLLELDQKYVQKSRILLPCEGLAALIENQELEKVPSYLNKLFQNIPKEKIEVVVLGCTHYPFIQKELLDAFSHDVIFVDGSLGVCKRVLYLLKENNIENGQIQKGKLSFILTDPKTEMVISRYLKSSF